MESGNGNGTKTLAKLTRAQQKELLRQGLAYPMFIISRTRLSTIEVLKREGFYDEECKFTLKGATAALLLVNEYRIGNIDYGCNWKRRRSPERRAIKDRRTG